MTKVPTLNRHGVTADVVTRILEYIAAEDLSPGDRLPSERQLSDALEVGRSSIREAVKSLALVGLIDVRHGDGMYLRGQDLDVLSSVIEWGLLLHKRRVLDLAETRRHLEIASAELAAARRTDEQLASMRTAMADMESAAAAQNRDAMVTADIAFHRAVVAAAGNVVMSEILASAESLLQVWIRKVLDEFGMDDDAHRQHQDVLAAIESRDAGNAAAAMRRHMESGFVRLSTALGQWTETD